MRRIKIFAVLTFLSLGLLWWIASGALRSEDVAPASPPHEAGPPTVEPAPATLARVGDDAAREQRVTAPAVAPSEEEAYTEVRKSIYTEHFPWMDEMQGRLAVLVRSGARPVAGARVLLFDADGIGRDWPASTVSGLQEVRTDSRGVASFSVPSGQYLVRAIDGERSVDSGRVSHLAGPRNRPVVLAFGRASIHGTAHDGAGAPRAGAEVHVFGLGPEPPRAYFRRTDSAGRFAFEHLVAGTYGIHLEQSDPWSSENERTLRLGVGDRAEVRFGWPEPGVTWSGQVATADATPVRGVRRLRFVELARRDSLHSSTDADGRFERVLPAGRWALYEGTADLAEREDQPRHAPPSSSAVPKPNEAPLAIVDVAPNAPFPPVVMPGSVLRVRLRPESELESAHPPDSVLLTHTTSIAAEPEKFEDGLVLQWTRLAPGPWTLSYPQPLLELDGRPATEGVELDVLPDTTIEREVRFRWVK